MAQITHDTAPSRVTSGLVLAVVSAATFGLSGSLARGLLDTGWTPGALVLARVGLGALVVAPFGLAALGGRWHLLRRGTGVMLLYGLLAVAGAQFCYFSAVQHMQVGPALLIEYTAPAAVVAWLWLRRGERPTPLTVAGAAVAAVGLVLVLDLLSGARLSPAGVAWALAAMVGAAVYFVVSADEGNGLPPLTLAAGGLMTGALGLAALGVVGVLPLRTARADVAYAGHVVAWWVPLLLLGLVTAAVAYATGIEATRRLGSRLASFVALLEVLAGVGFAWALLDELPRAVQLVGGLLVLTGVVAVRLGERRRPETSASTTPQPATTPHSGHSSDGAAA